MLINSAYTILNDIKLVVRLLSVFQKIDCYVHQKIERKEAVWATSFRYMFNCITVFGVNPKVQILS